MTMIPEKDAKRNKGQDVWWACDIYTNRAGCSHPVCWLHKSDRDLLMTLSHMSDCWAKPHRSNKFGENHLGSCVILLTGRQSHPNNRKVQQHHFGEVNKHSVSSVASKVSETIVCWSESNTCLCFDVVSLSVLKARQWRCQDIICF